MINKLLNARHWKLFVITTGIPFVLFIVMIIIQVSMIVSQQGQPATRMSANFSPAIIIVPAIIGIVMLFAAFIHFAWIFSVATGLQPFMHPEMRKLKVKRFRLFFFFPLAYAVVIPLFMFSISNMINVDKEPNLGVLIPVFILMFCLHFFSAFCMIYTLYFTAKTLRSAEMQKEAHFSDYIGEFFLIWFYPVGIWFIQPRVNAIVNGTAARKAGALPHANLLDKADF